MWWRRKWTEPLTPRCLWEVLVVVTLAVLVIPCRTYGRTIFWREGGLVSCEQVSKALRRVQFIVLGGAEHPRLFLPLSWACKYIPPGASVASWGAQVVVCMAQGPVSVSSPFPGNKRWAVLRELLGVELREQVKASLENLLAEGKGWWEREWGFQS